MKRLQILIDQHGHAQVSFATSLDTPQYEQFVKPFDKIQQVYQDDLHNSLQVALGSKQFDNPVLTKDDDNNLVSYDYQWRDCVQKQDHKYKFHLQKADTSKKISRGIGIIDVLEITIPASTSPLVIKPTPDKVRENKMIWKNFDWSQDLTIEFQE